MSNKNYNEVFTVTLENRSKEMADNISKNNALLTRLKDKGKMRPLTGGVKVFRKIRSGVTQMGHAALFMRHLRP